MRNQAGFLRSAAGDVVQEIERALSIGAAVAFARLRRQSFVLTDHRRRRRYNCHEQSDPRWQSRAETAVSLWLRHREGEAGRTRVGDFGAGSERLKAILERQLQTGFDYFPYDLHPQRQSVRRLDISRELPDEQLDVVFCLGVLEYLGDLPRLAARLRSCCPSAVVSYVPTDSRAGISRSGRKAIGWRSHLSTAELEEAFRDAGYSSIGSTTIDEGSTRVWFWDATRTNP